MTVTEVLIDMLTFAMKALLCAELLKLALCGVIDYRWKMAGKLAEYLGKEVEKRKSAEKDHA